MHPFLTNSIEERCDLYLRTYEFDVKNNEGCNITARLPLTSPFPTKFPTVKLIGRYNNKTQEKSVAMSIAYNPDNMVEVGKCLRRATLDMVKEFSITLKGKKKK